jgi:hypothetical protein
MTNEAHALNPQQAKYQPLFNLVCNRENWKYPIDAWVHPEELTALGASWNDLGKAVSFYTGSVATIQWKKGQIHVKAAGYYAAIGA